MKENYIFPFLWMRGESEADLRREMEKIHQANIGAVCVEARPHPDFAGEGWWHDMDIVLDEAKKKDMEVWILDDAHFPTGQANGIIPSKYSERARRFWRRAQNSGAFRDVWNNHPEAVPFFGLSLMSFLGKLSGCLRGGMADHDPFIYEICSLWV